MFFETDSMGREGVKVKVGRGVNVGSEEATKVSTWRVGCAVSVPATIVWIAAVTSTDGPLGWTKGRLQADSPNRMASIRNKARNFVFMLSSFY